MESKAKGGLGAAEIEIHYVCPSLLLIRHLRKPLPGMRLPAPTYHFGDNPNVRKAVENVVLTTRDHPKVNPCPMTSVALAKHSLSDNMDDAISASYDWSTRAS